jgi:hypothetical protein
MVDPVTIISAVSGLVTALGGTGWFVHKKRQRARVARARAAATHTPTITGRGAMPLGKLPPEPSGPGEPPSLPPPRK